MKVVVDNKKTNMLTKQEQEELLFFANKVANVHGPEHREYIEINSILCNMENTDLTESDFDRLRELTHGYDVPEWACKAQTRLLNLMKKMDNWE